ncbi:helix-turn-helix domain-containing protein [Adlercreutzia faecimuris]|uniref:DNA-binding protein n=1 Tax=Adlercreutzia faecimuris TaxID=2897341 RepID=A0ABS9WD73_9ACTN|nr:DNA-binding protein [Adlercreutzia sp. JBNU-10]MCI2240816.1 DNA-binding protein [Adlercreutzia sp. JBNU-10]
MEVCEEEAALITTQEAARRLGVSPRRVGALIAEGQLKAEKFGRAWMVDEASVARRQAAPTHAGRPKMGERDAGNLGAYTLMSRDHAVLDFTYNHRTGETADLVEREGIAWRPLGVGRIDRKPNRYDLAAWLAARSIPAVRPNLATALRALGARSASDLMFESLGLSLSDQYWLKPRDADVDWREVNYFENGYEEAFGDALLAGLPPAVGAKPTFSPDAATNGMLGKAWVRRDGVDCLMKAGSGNENREPYNEVLATRLLGRLLGSGDFVAYELTERGGRAFSLCATMIASDEELIAAEDVRTAFGISGGRDFHGAYLRALGELGVSDAQLAVDKMIVADFLMANFDRHTHNFGLIRSAESLDGYRVAPLYDHGCGFFSRATTAELEARPYQWESNPFREYPSQQLALVDDLSWYDPGVLDGFEEDIAEVLGWNPALDERFIAAVQRQVARQIRAVNDLAAERGLIVAGW